MTDESKTPETPSGSDPQPGSWILELRRRLEDPPPLGFSSSNGDGGAQKLVAMVGMRVESSELWCCFTETESDTDRAIWGECALGFPHGPTEEGGDSWLRVAELATHDLGLDSARVLRIGALEILELPDGRELQPLVVALPVPEPEVPSPVVAIPITALAKPGLVEEQLIEDEGRQIRQQIAHVGRYRLMGPTLWVVESLLLRLGMLD